MLGLYTRWFHRWALLIGWAVGMVFGTVAAYQQSSPATKHFGSSLDEVPFIGKLGYIALTAFVINLIVAVVLTFVFRAMKSPDGRGPDRAVGLLRRRGRPAGPADRRADRGQLQGQPRNLGRVLIRPARPDEYDEIGELAVRVYLAEGYTRTDSRYNTVLRDVAPRAEKAELMVAVDDADKILGTVTYAGLGSPYAEHVSSPEEASFRMLVVDPAARGQGVGEALVQLVHRPGRRLGGALAAAVHPGRDGRGRPALPAARLRPDPGAGLVAGARRRAHHVRPGDRAAAVTRPGR